MAQTAIKREARYTCADYLSWSDDERWEFGIGAGVLLAALVLAHG